MKLQKKITLLGAISMFMSLVDINIVNVSYPFIAKHFNVGVGKVAVISMIFLMALAISIPIVGKLNDIIGIRTVLLAGYCVFILSGIGCALSTSLNLLTVFRGIQGVGAGMLSISGTASLVAFVPKKERGEALGYMATAGAFGLILGAPLGGFLTGWFGWQAIFWSVVPIAVLVLVYAYYIVPPALKVTFKEGIKQFDFKGALFITFFIALVVFVMISFIKKHQMSRLEYVLSGLGVLSFILFVFQDLNSPKPLLGITVLKDRHFTLMVIINMLAVILLSITNFFIPFFLAIKLSFSPEQTGIMLLMFSVTYGGFSSIVGKLSDKKLPEAFCLTGIIVVLLTNVYFLLALNAVSKLTVAIVLGGLGTAFAFFLVPVTKLVLNKPNKENAGSITAIFRVTRQLASLIGIVIVVLVSNGTNKESMDFALIIKWEIVIAFVAAILLGTVVFRSVKE
jgi:MFS family permease